MATIPTRRGFAQQDPNNGGPPTLLYPATTLTGDPGDALTAVNGVASNASVNVLTTSTNNLGFLEQRVSSTSNPVPITLFIPCTLYEMSFIKASAAADRLAANAYLLQDDASGVYASINGTAGATGICNVLLFKGDLIFIKDQFIAMSGTSVTAGSTNVPDAIDGAAGDTNPRALVYFLPTGCAVTQ